MFGRQVILKLKPNSVAELARINEKEIVPLLFKQKGFREQTHFVAPERSEAISTSLWDSKEDAEAYNRTAYPEIVKALSTVSDGPPTVKTFDVATSTGQKVAGAKVP